MSRSQALRGLLCEVQRTAEAEDTQTILRLLQEAGIERNAHVGDDKDNFTDDDTVEWVLGQWLDVIESGEHWALNSARNISQRYAVDLCGYVPGAAQ